MKKITILIIIYLFATNCSSYKKFRNLKFSTKQQKEIYEKILNNMIKCPDNDSQSLIESPYYIPNSSIIYLSKIKLEHATGIIKAHSKEFPNFKPIKKILNIETIKNLSTSIETVLTTAPLTQKDRQDILSDKSLALLQVSDIFYSSNKYLVLTISEFKWSDFPMFIAGSIKAYEFTRIKNKIVFTKILEQYQLSYDDTNRQWHKKKDCGLINDL